MATALLISKRDLIRNTIIDGSVDVEKYLHFIRLAQEIHLQNILGTKLLRKIQDDIVAGTLAGDYKDLVDNYLKDILIHYAMTDYIPFDSYSITNGGIQKHQGENAEIPEKVEVDSLIEKHREFAQFFTRRFIDFINNNSSKFPEYLNNNQEDMFPSQNADFTGWVL